MNSIQSIGIIANSSKPESAGVAHDILSAAKKKKIRVTVNQETARLLGFGDATGMTEMARRCDLIFVLGGDGTMLQVARLLKGAQTPLLGINLGGLGFLTAAGVVEARESLRDILSGKFITSARSQIRVRILRGDETAFEALSLNEVVISRADVLRTIRIDVEIDGEEFTTYSGDGLICATPTGSTAYSLSGGGPVLHPEAQAMVITPVCPHALANRSVVLSDRSCLTARIHQQEYSINVTVDGQDQFGIHPSDRIILCKAREKVQLAKLEGYSYYRVLREKLKWRGSNIEVLK